MRKRICLIDSLWNEADIAEVSTEVVRLSPEVRKSCRRDKKQRILRLCEEMDEAGQTGRKKCGNAQDQWQEQDWYSNAGSSNHQSTNQRTVWEVLMEMERFIGRAKAEDQGVVALVLDLAEAFERVSLLVLCAWATYFSFPRKILRVLCGYFEHQRRVHFEGCAAEPFHPITAILPGSKWSCLLLRIVLQDALNDVTKICLTLLKLRVFVDDVTALVQGRNKEVAEMAKKVMKKLKEEVEKKGIKLSVSENREEGKSKMIASCGFLENELSQFSKGGGVTLTDSVETLGVDLRTRVKRLGAKEKARRKKCKVRFSLIKKNE